MDSFDKGWFVLQTYSGYENKVKENLLQRAQTYNMLENILRVEIPTQTVQVEKNGKKKEIEENRFPGYVLVEMVMTDEAWFVVRNTPNVTGFVGSHGNRSKPTPLLEQEIRDILVSMGQTVQEFDIDVQVGQTVRIIDGAFADYTGKITEIDNNKVKMIISMFGNDTVAEVNLNQIAELQSGISWKFRQLNLKSKDNCGENSCLFSPSLVSIHDFHNIRELKRNKIETRALLSPFLCYTTSRERRKANA